MFDPRSTLLSVPDPSRRSYLRREPRNLFTLVINVAFDTCRDLSIACEC